MKPWYQSKTIIVNSLTAAAGVATIAADFSISPYAIIAVAFINIALRFVTALPVNNKPATKKIEIVYRKYH